MLNAGTKETDETTKDWNTHISAYSETSFTFFLLSSFHKILGAE